jgi:hypothetical protein
LSLKFKKFATQETRLDTSPRQRLGARLLRPDFARAAGSNAFPSENIATTTRIAGIALELSAAGAFLIDPWLIIASRYAATHV